MNPTSFLYPFLDEPVAGLVRTAAPSDPGRAQRRSALLADLSRSATEKWLASKAASTTALGANKEGLQIAASLLGSAGRILIAGNGGSSCDAARLIRLLSVRPDLRALSLISDPAALTALANDIGVERMFARLVDAFGRPGDALVVLSTSGQSPNLLAALASARRRGLHTIAFGGYGGGRFVDNRDVDIAITVDDPSVHRIQEAQAALIDALVGLLMPGGPT